MKRWMYAVLMLAAGVMTTACDHKEHKPRPEQKAMTDQMTGKPMDDMSKPAHEQMKPKPADDKKPM